MDIIQQAKTVFLDNFPAETCFERAVFFSWYCEAGDCKYCYMSTQPREVIEKKKIARRSQESILAEFFLCKKLGWDIGFFSGGQRAFSTVEFEELLKNIYKITGEKIWINIGALKEEEIIRFKPYIKGVVAAVETINQEVHDYVCPSKPLAPMENMLGYANKHDLMKAITIILGLGETIDDFEKLKYFINKYKIDKIHFYGLNPHPGTVFENTLPPSEEYQAEWIAKTRIEFPKIDIQCGIWVERVNRVSTLLSAGANSVSKFPAIRYFGKKESKMIEEQASKAGRKFVGSLTKIPKMEIKGEIKKSDLGPEITEKVILKVEQYLKTMRKNIK